MAVVSGRLQIRDWTDREGGKRRSAEIVADNVYFGDSRPAGNDGGRGGSYGGNDGGRTPGGNAGSTGSTGQGPFGPIDDGDGELPF